MQVIKNINNNVSLCLDSTGTQVIAFGKGIGFKRPPYEIGLAEVEKTFYDVDERYVRMIQDIPFEVIETSNDIIEHSKGKLSSRLSPNIVFTLADHIKFAIQRAINGMNFDLPIKQDIQHLFPEEAEVGRYAVARIKESLHITLPDEEALYVALHIINGELDGAGRKSSLTDTNIEEIIKIIERDCGVSIDRDCFFYSRFVSHLNYLATRQAAINHSEGDAAKLYSSLTQMYQLQSRCANHIVDYLNHVLNTELNIDENVYLIMHIVRLCESRR